MRRRARQINQRRLDWRLCIKEVKNRANHERDKCFSYRVDEGKEQNERLYYISKFQKFHLRRFLVALRHQRECNKKL